MDCTPSLLHRIDVSKCSISRIAPNASPLPAAPDTATVSTVWRGTGAVGTTAEMAHELMDLAARMVQAGADVLLIEGVPAEVTSVISQRVSTPVIGCGAGPGCDGQVLVAPDILGLICDWRTLIVYTFMLDKL